jgi:hypothetical protein
VPAGTPTALFQTERYDGPGGAEMQWSFPVTPGNYEVRLYFAEIFGSAGSPDARVFDVRIEGELVLDDYDVYVAAGNALNRGVMESFVVNSNSVLNVNFSHVVENPAIKGIEILTFGATADLLLSDRTNVNFGQTLIGGPATEQVEVTNIGDSGDPTITIDPSQIVVTGTPEFSAAFQTPGIVTLAPRESAILDVTYSPLGLGSDSAQLTIPHSGSNSPTVVALTGNGINEFTVAFSTSTLNLSGASLNRPTSLQFGPDGRLYVTQGDGFIKVLEVIRDTSDSYRVVASETIDVVRQIPNYNDDGSPAAGVTGRLITGLVVTGTAENPIIYVSNSDPRFYDGDVDTKSGQIARITRVNGVWVRHDVVRGLPRSKADHSNEGLALLRDENGTLTNMLLHSVGGFTNRGGPSASFLNEPEVALSAAVLSIDLDAIGETTYDIPSLDDEDRANTGAVDQYGVPIDVNDHIGGNSGKNQSRLAPDGPVQIYSPGYRNPYDVLVTLDGRVYVTDNGPNNGFGVNAATDENGQPTNDVVPGNGSNITAPDQLHYVPQPGFFAGHVNPTRANANNTFNETNPQSPVVTTVNGVEISLENPNEFPFIEPGSDGALRTYNSSTNGIAEYTTANFGGAMQGDILTISLDGTLVRVKHDPDTGQVLVNEVLASGLGPRALDVTTVGAGPLAGTIWVASYDGNVIRVLEPTDGNVGTDDDRDGDGYSNQDEVDNGTNPDNAASVPTDFDQDFTSDLNDPNDDNDSLLDIDDPFAIDGQKGAGNPIGTYFAWANDSVPAGKILDLGLTGSMINGATNYRDTFDPANVTAIGAAGVFTIDSALPGTARGAANNIQQALQFGFQAAFETKPFTATTEILEPFNGIGVPSPGQEQGFYIGLGDQDNYVALILSGDNGGSIQVFREVEGAFTVPVSLPFSLPTTDNVEMFLTVDPATHTVQAAYRFNQASPMINVGSSIDIPAAWLTGTMAVGLWSSDPTNSGNMPVTWNHLGVVRDPADRAAGALITVDGGGFGGSTEATGAFAIENTSQSGQKITSVAIDLSTSLLPGMVFDPNGTAGDASGKTFAPNAGAAITGWQNFLFSDASNGGFRSLEMSFTDFAPGEIFTFSADVDPTINGDAPAGLATEVSGVELAGALITVHFGDGTSTVSRLAPASGGGPAAFSETRNGAPSAPGLSVLGAGALPNVVAPADQTVRLTGPVGAHVILQQIEASLATVGGLTGPQLLAGSSFIAEVDQEIIIGASGFVDVPITLLRSAMNGGINYIIATIEDALGRRSELSSVVVVSRPIGSEDYDYNGDFVVDALDYQVWKRSFGSSTNSAADGNGDGQIDAADYTIWRDHLGEVIEPPAEPDIVVNIDFGNGPLYAGLGAAEDPDSGTVWNRVINTQAAGTGPLVDSIGMSTTVSLSFDTISQFDTGSDTQGERGPGGILNPLMQDYLFSPTLKSFTIGGLTPGASYELYLYGQGDVNNQETTFDLGGQPLTTSFDATIGGNGLLIEGIEYVVFRSVLASASGQIAFSMTGIGNDGGFNGLQVLGSGALGGGSGAATVVTRERLTDAAVASFATTDNGIAKEDSSTPYFKVSDLAFADFQTRPFHGGRRRKASTIIGCERFFDSPDIDLLLSRPQLRESSSLEAHGFECEQQRKDDPEHVNGHSAIERIGHLRLRGKAAIAQSAELSGMA